ncbi:MAG TPA: hypothetical protein VFZ27_07570 [Terriglobia bacterium]|nr:hypothetical protein [Terriglobia bacterium]
MSAVGGYAVLRRAAFAECVELAKSITRKHEFRWPFKDSLTIGMEEFKAAWDAALMEKVEFGYSWYAIGNYLDAQEQVNSAPNRHERTEAALALSRAFTAAFPFEEKKNFAEFPPDKLLAWCRKEYANDAGNMAEL